MLHQLLLLSALVALALASVVPKVELDGEWQGRIVGGTLAGDNQFSYQCSLRSSQNTHFCGCSIVNTRWALSAAHCTVGRTSANTKVVVGTNSLTVGGVSHDSARIVNHPNYNSGIIANDVSLVQTVSVITFNAATQPIALGSDTVGGGVNSVVSGWGQTSYPGSLSIDLMFLNVTTVDNVACAEKLGIFGLMILASSLCAGGVKNQGVCLGDSGGPLITGGNVIGIVSWGIACANEFPDVYARVSSFRTWIMGYTG